jgi:hypothetical protein
MCSTFCGILIVEMILIFYDFCNISSTLEIQKPTMLIFDKTGSVYQQNRLINWKSDRFIDTI